MIDSKDVTIIMPHLGANEDMERSFELSYGSLLNYWGGKILVVKNGPKECDDYRHITLIDQGQCKAVNAAVAITNTPWIFVTNDDMIYAPGWWDKLTGALDTSLSCISPRLVEPRPGAPTFEVYFCGGAGGDFDKMKWLEFAKNYKGQGLRTGFNLPFLIKRELWDTIGGYDINYDPWGSNGDSDLEYKIKLAGIQPMQNTDCVVYHFSQTSGTFLPENDSYRFKNYAYFKEKWGFDRTDDGIWEATFEIPPENKFHPSWENFYGKNRNKL